MGKRVRDINIKYRWYELVDWDLIASLFIGAGLAYAVFINLTTGF